MDDSQWTQVLWAPFGDVDDVVAFILVVGVLGLRVWPSTRRWAPRGNARPARRDSATRPDEPGNPPEPATKSHRGRGTELSQQDLSCSPTPALRR